MAKIDQSPIRVDVQLLFSNKDSCYIHTYLHWVFGNV